MKTKCIMFLCCLLVSGVFSVDAQTLAFPGAEGGGMYTTGGRGGKVYYVTSLEDTLVGDKELREGTLRWCLDRSGPKTILFKVAGIIHLKSRLNVSENTTIAGQSAPGDGICIADNNVKITGDNVIIRFMRFRMGDLTGLEDDAISGYRNKNIIIDHCSMSWSTDECASFYDNENFTLQWSIISESLRTSVHRKGNHGYGGIWGGHMASFHHNLLAHHDSRNPRMCGSRYSNRPDLELVDFRNNAIYNWGSNSGYAGEGGRYNFINNYYKPTESSSNKNRIFSPNADDGTNKQPKGIWGQFFLKGNVMEGNQKTTKDNSLGLQPNPSSKNVAELLVASEFKVVPIKTDKAEDAFDKILSSAGASLKRDNTDLRVVNETRNGLTPVRASRNTTTRPGMIDSQSDVGGWDVYGFAESEVVKDSDNNGIPDGWLEKNYPGKLSTDLDPSGYTYLEVYLNSLVADIIK
ncbi:pectate lyase family protein [Dysgonomonas macrotermitis]|uniref:Pectate lyase n=1 Tax=Dysgonomonas macrotermitis TaxID=1346286 RepID=A0A1M5GIH0_9BACT|nr:pectate lyase [Dysgonomonas macrotermitis]SHG03503.1 Pectate lyase [Dysgonomonas macrotermitis]